MMSFQIIQDESKWYFVNPMHLGGTLHEHIMKHKYLDEAETQEIFRKILLILAVCHSLGISVTAISLHSFAFADCAKLESTPMFDFRTSLRHISPLKMKIRDQLTVRTGFAIYAAPENLSVKTSFIGRFSDMWSAGETIFLT